VTIAILVFDIRNLKKGVGVDHGRGETDRMEIFFSGAAVISSFAKDTCCCWFGGAYGVTGCGGCCEMTVSSRRCAEEGEGDGDYCIVPNGVEIVPSLLDHSVSRLVSRLVSSLSNLV